MRNLAFVCTVAIFGLLFPHQADAQSFEKKWAFGTGATFVDYQGPQTGTYFQPGNFDPGIHLSLHRYLTGAFNLSTNVLLAQGVRFPGKDWTESRPGLVDMNYLFTFKFNNGALFRESAVIAPYFHLGIGGSYLQGHPDLYVPLGGGIQFRFSPKVAMRTQVTLKRSLNKDHQHMAHAISFVYNLSKDKPETKTPNQSPPPPDPMLAKRAPKDADDDGIVDERDECPNEAGLITYYGCPTVDALNMAKIKDTPIAYDGKNALALMETSQSGPSAFGAVSDLAVLDQTDIVLNQSNDAVDYKQDKDQPVAKSSQASTTSYNQPTFLDPVASNSIKESTEIDFSGANNASNGTTFSTPAPKDHNKLNNNDLEINPIFFSHDSHVLTEETKAILDEVASMLHTHSEAQLIVKGHADALGTDQYNLVLSIMRAYHVKYYLVNKRGISQHRITSNGFGEEASLSNNATDDDRQQNRRVDFELVF